MDKAAALEDPIEEAAAISWSCNTFPHSLSGLLVVKIIGLQVPIVHYGKSTLVASGS